MFSKKLIGTLGAGLFALGIASPADAAIQTVTNTNSSGNGSLRDAIVSANSTAARDTILFQIAGAGPHVIALANGLPAITQPVAIRGYSEPDASPATANSAANPSVVIDATNAVRGLSVNGNGIEVRGLVIENAQVDGIWVVGSDNVVAGNYIGTDETGSATTPNGEYGVHVDGNDNVVGGPAPADRNLLTGNFFGGVRLHSGVGNVVEGNYLGTDETGTVGLANGGVLIDASQNTMRDNLSSFSINGVTVKGDDNTVQGNSIGTDVDGDAALGNIVGVSVVGGDRNVIGGAAEGEGNLVSGNLFSGVSFSRDNGDPAEDNDVQGNLIGTDASGTAALPNEDAGVSISASNGNAIGGVADGEGNVISGNGTDGVRIQSDGADDNDVQGNWIGTDEAETVALGNGESGVDIVDGAQNLVGATVLQNPANVIAHNGGDGVTVTNTDGNAIVRNSMYDNGDLGIDLDADGPTPNDGPRDLDTGGNTLQNGPDIDAATTTEVEWELETVAGKTYRLEFFANDACDPSGSGEGQTFLGTIEVTTDNNGEADDTTPLAVPAGKFVSMTATRLTDGNLLARSTSEFSPCEEVQ